MLVHNCPEVTLSGTLVKCTQPKERQAKNLVNNYSSVCFLSFFWLFWLSVSDSNSESVPKLFWPCLLNTIGESVNTIKLIVQNLNSDNSDKAGIFVCYSSSQIMRLHLPLLCKSESLPFQENGSNDSRGSSSLGRNAFLKVY